MRSSGSHRYKDKVMSWLPSSPCGCFLSLQMVADLSARTGKDLPKDAEFRTNRELPRSLPILFPDAEGRE